MSNLDMQRNDLRASKMNRLAYVLTIAVLGLVLLMRRVKIPTDIDFSFLPPLHAILNTGTFIALLLALYFVKNKNIRAHRNAIYVAGVLSAIFLLGYVLYHFTTVETTYGGDGVLKIIYYFVLISHILLAAVSFPFILLTFIRGFNFQIEEHRKMAKFTYPLWLYVSITGPIVYLMLKPYYA
jgi:putative membrane protein